MNDQEAKLFLQQIRNVSKNETQSNTKTCIKTTPAYVISVNGQMATVRLVTDLTGANPFNVPIITSQTISPGDYANLAYWDNLSTAVIFSGGNNYPICPNIPIRPNLIDNGYFVGGGTGFDAFPVNQRGLTSYITGGVGRYTIDRWVAESALNIILENDGLNIEVGGTGSFSFIQYAKLDDIKQKLNGKTVTLSILTSQSHLGTATVQNFNAESPNLQTPYVDGISCSCSYFSIEGNKIQLARTNGTGKIAAIKLEEGPGQTLAYQTSNGAWAMLPQNLDYRQELAKCQAYYWGSSIVFASNTHFNEGHLLCNVQFPVKMRAIPAVTIKSVSGTPGILSYWASMGDSQVTATANPATISDEGFNDLATSAMQSGAAYAFRVVASAEL